MSGLWKGLTLVAGLCFSLMAGAQEQPGVAKIAFGTSLEPFVMEKTQSGVELDIVRAALGKAGYRLVPVFLPQARVPEMLRHGVVDAAATLIEASGIPAIYSDPYIEYQDMAITLKSRGLKIERISDIAGLRVVGFQNARKHLGERFRRAVEGGRYFEVAQQFNQNRLLYEGLVDVVIAEHRIFRYQDKRLTASKFTERPQPVEMHPVFDKIPYRLACRNEQLCDAFNQGLKALSDKEKSDIYARYGND